MKITPPKDKKQAIIRIDGVYKSFQTGKRITHILKDINLEISIGEFLIIFGPSGCGKSTLLHAVMGLERPDLGTITLGGINVWLLNNEDRADIRKHEIGIMYQNQNWIRSLNVEENIAFPAQLIGFEKEIALEKARELLKLVGMGDRAEYIPSELSSGEQQKIGVARALITDPKILIADEPTGNLDVKSGFEMMQLFSKLRASGKTIIMVTHNQEYLKYANRAIIMLDGRIRKEIEIPSFGVEKMEKEIIEELKVLLYNNREGISTKEEIISEPVVYHEPLPRKNIFERIKYSISFIIRFVFQLTFFSILTILGFLSRRFVKFVGYSIQFKKKFASISRKLDRNFSEKISASINSIDLAEVSFKNLWVKKSRSLITIVGMAVGIGFIAFLLSIGYGLERLVLNEVTKIQDMKQIDVMPTASSNVYLNNENIEFIEKINGVEKVLPLINLAGRAKFEKATTDVVVYGTVPEYLNDSSITKLEGEFFSEERDGILVNEEFLKTLGVQADQILGKELAIDFTLTKEQSENLSTNSISQNVLGVLSDGNPAVVYVSLNSLRDLNISEYSQLRVKISSENQIVEARKQIEVLGFATASVMDTVADVENLFKYAKIALFVIGTIALSIAILGMFNTLTVSLLERTREVGLMKTIGMKSDEIRILFINESMLMGILGGILGLTLGLCLGGVISLTVSVISIINGGGFIALNFLPFYVGGGILLMSILVGFITGLYPSNRAVKMAPLDALRYE